MSKTPKTSLGGVYVKNSQNSLDGVYVKNSQNLLNELNKKSNFFERFRWNETTWVILVHSEDVLQKLFLWLKTILGKIRKSKKYYVSCT